MNKSEFEISTIRVAKPCHMAWDSMRGDDRVRRCGECELNIYNIADMTAGEVESLIENREGRLCIRLHRRADGTVITRDCPVGLRAYQKRVARMATAAAAAVLGLFSISFGQENGKEKPIEGVKITRLGNARASQLRGVVVDSYGAVIPGATVKLRRGNEKKPAFKKTDNDGTFSFSELRTGIYRVEISMSGFKKLVYENLEVKNEAIEINIMLEAGAKTVTVGIFLEEPLIDFTVTGPTTTKITREMIERLPGRRPF